MLFSELINKIKFSKNIDRIGPDIFWTYWRFFLNTKMTKLCKKKFLHFGHGSEIRPGAYVIGCSQISIGERVVIRPGTMLHGESDSLENTIVIEDDVLIGCGVHIYVENHNFSNPNLLISEQGHSIAKQVVLKKGCWIGANVIILPGVIVGINSVVGAGAVVTKSIPDGVVAVGNPAKVLKMIG
jgi:acetyltransferase-like isoleucine patch superfamily enzyme